MANSTVQNKKVISLALGAVADGAYLYAGADRAIAAEMQGKDNGDVIYYKTTNLGQAEISDVSMGNPANTGLASLDIASATPVKHRQVPVKIKDARVMYNVKAIEKQITSLGKDIAMGKIGQKLAKKAIAESLAVSRARGMFQDAVEKTIEAHDISVLKKDPDYKILKTEYAMFPAWFLTFRYEDVPYTLLVNGQTEKIIGGVPYDRTKVAVSFAIAAVILSILSVIVLSFLLLDPDSDESIKIITAVIVFGLIGLVSGISNFKTVKESATLTSLSETNNFVKNRGQ